MLTVLPLFQLVQENIIIYNLYSQHNTIGTTDRMTDINKRGEKNVHMKTRVAET